MYLDLRPPHPPPPNSRMNDSCFFNKISAGLHLLLFFQIYTVANLIVRRHLVAKSVVTPQTKNKKKQLKKLRNSATVY